MENVLQKNPFLLAPMAGITDVAFRSFMKELGCGAVTTELVSANGLRFNSEKTKRIMAIENSQKPVGIQIFGETPEDLAFAAKESEQMGASFIDLNFGCPVNKIVKKGAGSAVLKDLLILKKILRTVKLSISIPLTIKIRTGWSEDTRNSEEVSQIAYDEGISWVAIHGRTRTQAYKGRADWDYISSVGKKSKVPIIGNGDITSPTMAQEKLYQFNCQGVMIGRGCLKNPWIFKQAQNLKVEKNFRKLFQRLIFFLENKFEERIVLLQVKKFASWYSSGYPNSSSFRKNLFQTKDRKELYTRVDEYYDEHGVQIQKNTSDQPFLMGGHG